MEAWALSYRPISSKKSNTEVSK
jgi:methionine synthase I (cobalamin-dependent)